MPTKTDYILMGIGAFAAVLITSYVPSLMKVMGPAYLPEDYAACPGCKEQYYYTPSPIENFMGNSTLDSIEGIDHELLSIARQKGLM